MTELERIHDAWNYFNFHESIVKTPINQLSDGDHIYAATPINKTQYVTHFFVIHTLPDDGRLIAVFLDSEEFSVKRRLISLRAEGKSLIYELKDLQAPYSNWPKKSVGCINEYVAYHTDRESRS